MKYVASISLGVSLALAGCGSSSGFFERVNQSQNGSITGDGYNTPIRQSYIQAFEHAAYDVLWVLDNSGSMVAEVNYVRDNMAYFAQVMQTRRLIEYQMAVVNTDWRDNTWGHGKLRGPVPVIRYDHSDPVGEFEDAVNDIHMCANGPCSGTNGDEMGLVSARQALTDNGAAFIRTDANLMVIFVSDEEDSSCTPNAAGTACANPRTSLSVNTFVTYFNSVKPAGTGVTALYPLVGNSLSDCSTILSVGQRYLDVLTGFGTGARGSICEAEFGNGINRIANTIADNGLCFPLAYDPKRTSIRVFVDGEVQADGFSFDPLANAVCFDTNHVPSNGSQVVNEYYRK